MAKGRQGQMTWKKCDVEATPTHLAEPSGKLIIYGDPVKSRGVM